MRRLKGSTAQDFLRVTVLAGLVILTACHRYVDQVRFDELARITPPKPAPNQALNVFFLGTGGIYLQANGVSILLDPFFTNPHFWRVLSPFPTTSKKGRIQEELGILPDIDQLQSILVSHSHYDHAMDLPFIIAEFHPDQVYGSETLGCLLGPDAPGLFSSLNTKALDPTQATAEWIHPSPLVRFAAVRAEHFSHFLGITYADGEYRQRPSRLYDWRAGETYSFVIDIFANSVASVPTYRIFYMPSGAKHPIGTPPSAILDDGKTIDLAIISAAQLEKDATYPGALLRRIKPAAVMLVHWDNFFDGYAENPLMNFRVDPKEIATRITDAIGTRTPVYWPERGAALLCSPAVAPELAKCSLGIQVGKI